MKKILKKLVAPLAIGAMAVSMQAGAADLQKRVFCVFDLIGKSGPVYSAMQDYRLQALNWGVDLELRPYSDEKIVAEEFKAGTCDMAAITGLRGRGFNPFTGTLDSIGSIPDYSILHAVLEKLASPQLAPLMKSGDYEVVGIAPAGGAYLMVNDRNINTVNALSGKKIAVLDFDKSQAVMVESIGASPVTATIANFGSMFNNGAVDVIGAPAVAFQPLELYKGIGTKGGVIDYALVQLTLQVLIRPSKFPEGFGQKSREYVYSQYDRNMAEITKSTEAIKPEYWVKISDKDKIGYQEMLRQSRLKLRDEGIYDGKMLKFLSRVRCELDASLTECTAKDRE
ncbi:RND type efflux pump involved in aminoglycoside resistance [gamma proteobacterium HdN1]|nr:RND type efflux pump involved in aminoglycoside resistance [gamma proteobacterium HdN1]